jgi:hypothetical protein
MARLGVLLEAIGSSIHSEFGRFFSNECTSRETLLLTLAREVVVDRDKLLMAEEGGRTPSVARPDRRGARRWSTAFTAFPSSPLVALLSPNARSRQLRAAEDRTCLRTKTRASERLKATGNSGSNVGEIKRLRAGMGTE